MALTNKLTAIGDAIRAKTGDTAKLTLDEMASEIAEITVPTPHKLAYLDGAVKIYIAAEDEWNRFSPGYFAFRDIYQLETKATEIPNDCFCNARYYVKENTPENLVIDISAPTIGARAFQDFYFTSDPDLFSTKNIELRFSGQNPSFSQYAFGHMYSNSRLINLTVSFPTLVSIPYTTAAGQYDNKLSGGSAPIISPTTTFYYPELTEITGTTPYSSTNSPFGSVANGSKIIMPKFNNIPYYCFYTAKTGIIDIDFQNVTTLKKGSFQNIGNNHIETKLSSYNFPSLTSTEENVFAGSRFSSEDLPLFNSTKLWRMGNTQSPLLPGTRSFSSIYMSQNGVRYGITFDFRGGIDLTSSANRIFDGYQNTPIGIVIRNTTVPALSYPANTTNGFIGSTSQDVKLYVPRDLISSYESATNWSVMAGKFYAIEDYPELVLED